LSQIKKAYSFTSCLRYTVSQAREALKKERIKAYAHKMSLFVNVLSSLYVHGVLLFMGITKEFIMTLCLCVVLGIRTFKNMCLIFS